MMNESHHLSAYCKLRVCATRHINESCHVMNESRHITVHAKLIWVQGVECRVQAFVCGV